LRRARPVLLLFISLSWLCVWFCGYFWAAFIALKAGGVFVVLSGMSTAADGPRCRSHPSRAGKRGSHRAYQSATCDTESKEIECKGKAREEIYALAKSTINKSCHKQRSLVSILPRFFFQTFPLLRTAFSVHPCRYSDINVFTLTYLQPHFFRGVEYILSIKDTFYHYNCSDVRNCTSYNCTKYLNIF